MIGMQIGQNLRRSGIHLRQRSVIQIDILPEQVAAIVVFAVEQPIQAVDVVDGVPARDFFRPTVLGVVCVSADCAAGYFRLLHLPGGVPHITLRTDRRDISGGVIGVAGPADRGDLITGAGDGRAGCAARYLGQAVAGGVVGVGDSGAWIFLIQAVQRVVPVIRGADLDDVAVIVGIVGMAVDGDSAFDVIVILRVLSVRYSKIVALIPNHKAFA